MARTRIAAVHNAAGATAAPMRPATAAFNKVARIVDRLLGNDLDYNLVRASMVAIYFFFGYQKWFDYEGKVLIPYIDSGPFIFWLHPAFGIQGASYFLGVFEWLFGALILAGFWNKRAGLLGAAGSTATFLMTVSIIPFIPGGWEPSAGGFPAMVGPVAFLMKDVALLAISIYLLKQDAVRVLRADAWR
jgi:uncharacterized membrane protein YkgB